MPITFHETLTENQFFSDENKKWIVQELNKNGMWGKDECDKVLEFLWDQYQDCIECHESNHGLKEINGEIYSEMEDGIIPLGYSYDGLINDLDDLLNELNGDHEETEDDHGVDLNNIVDKFFCE